MNSILKLSIPLLITLATITLLPSQTPSSSSSLSPSTYFSRWASLYSKNYPSQQELTYRMAKFTQNLHFVKEHNLKYWKGEETYQVQMNVHADMDTKQFTNKYFDTPQKQGTFDSHCSGTIKLQQQLPFQHDWSPRAVTPPKTQGSCSSGYAIATAQAMEGLARLTTGILYNFSAQQIVDCSTPYGNKGCNGGEVENSLLYLIEEGITNIQNYPYVGVQQQCNYTAGKKIFSIKNCAKVPQNNSNQLKNAVVKQPVIVNINSNSLGFQLYKRGIFTGNCGTNSQPMLLLGYGVLEQKKYWKVKNSWGLSWGQEGYIFLNREEGEDGSGQCGILTSSWVPLVE